MTKELIIKEKQLPVALQGLVKFVLIGREKLTAVRAEIRAIDKLDLANGVREQKIGEAQMFRYVKDLTLGVAAQTFHGNH